MAEEWFSGQGRSRFSREHRDRLDTGAHMIDCDGAIWIPYVPDAGQPLMVVELKTEQSPERGWFVTQALAALAGIPAALIIELENGRYRVLVATEKTKYLPYHFPEDLTIEDWYEKVERPLRDRHTKQNTVSNIKELFDL